MSEEEQSYTFYKKFLNQPSNYYGDEDEDEELLAYEREAEEEGETNVERAVSILIAMLLEWTNAYRSLAQTLKLPLDTLEVPPIPRPNPKPLVDADGDADMTPQAPSNVPPALAFLSPEELAPPKLPTKTEMEAILLDIRKKALLEEYIGNDAQAGGGGTS